jgi:parvulin-like peptidyl-prolyl isomerase
VKPRATFVICLAFLVVAACQQADSKLTGQPGSGGSGTTVTQGSGSGTKVRPGGGSGSAHKPFQTPAKDIDSKDILGRAESKDEVSVKHILLGWAELVTVYGKRIDERASKRTNEQAATLAQELLAKLKAKPGDLDALVKEHSEDPGMKSGEPYLVVADSPFVPEFKKLALRLNLNEAGIVKTQFGYHVMMRVAPPPPDPLESTDILARPAQDIDLEVQHVLIGWKDLVTTADDRAKKRTKEEADKLAKEILGKVRAGGDMAKLMKEYSEDPGSKDNARAYEVSKNATLVEPFKRLSLRLKEGEAGLVKTEFGWHIIKRVPPDKLVSTAILDRKTTAPKVKVKHILIGWDGANMGDPRGAKRTRAELEKLVAEIVAKLKKGDKIEPLMKQYSEHKDSAESGKEFDIAATSQGLPATFKNVSLRLEKNEVGVVKTQFGIHILQRVE